MQKKLLILTTATIAVFSINLPKAAAQLGIGTATPAPSAMLDISSTNKGVLLPTMTAANRAGISAPATGLLVFQTDGIPGFYYYNGSNWVAVGTNGAVANNSGYLVGTVTTLAGSGFGGSTDATGTAASFNNPYSVAVDASGNVYVADAQNNKIRKVTSAGVVTTFAGSGSAGSTDATGTAASFNFPTGVAVDAGGNVYVADASSHKIRKITSAGAVTTIAGSGSIGSTDATGTAASFNYPYGVAVDAAGNVYVADNSNHKIRKVTAAGVVTTLAGSGSIGSTDATGTAASFNYPTSVAVDAGGNVYCADNNNHKIRKVTSAGVVTTLAGSGNSGSIDATGTAASFNYPFGVAVDASGNVYVGDQNNQKIRMVTSLGVVTTLAGSGSQGSINATGTAASFYLPSGLAVDASGYIYVGDRGNNKIRKIVGP